MKIGVIGSGDVAKVLGGGFLKHGFEVMMGTRDATKLASWKAEYAAARVGSVAETAAFGEVLVLAVKGTAAEVALQSAGAAALAGKVVIDATNPIADAPPEKGVLRFFSDINESLMEQLQRAFPEARFVKAFNSVGNARMVNPSFPEWRPTMFICGNDSAAKKKVIEILDTFGWETADMGEVEAARAIEPLCILWCIRGFRENQWGHAFKLLK